MPQEIQLPDGRTLVIPDNTTLDQRAALRNKLGSQYADVKTGKGMEQRAMQQSRGQLTSRVQRDESPQEKFNRVQEEGYQKAYGKEAARPGSVTLTDADVAQLGLGGMGIGKSIATRGLKATALPVARGVVGATAGAYGGGQAGKYLGGETGETVGKIAGGALGGYAGVRGLSGKPNSLLERVLTNEPAPPIPEPSPMPIGATSSAAPMGKATLPPAPTTPQPPMTLGTRTAARTAPPQPSGVTRVPVPREPLPGDPNLMGSVPRPELPGMAERGVPGAADQQRLLGEPVIYTPPEGNPPGSFEELQSKLQERIPQPESPNLTQRTTAAPAEDAMEAARRGAPGVNPVAKSLRRQLAKPQRPQLKYGPDVPIDVESPTTQELQRQARERAARIREANQ